MPWRWLDQRERGLDGSADADDQALDEFLDPSANQHRDR